MAENKDKKKNFHSVVSGYIDYVPKDYNAFVSALKSDPALADRLYSDLVKLEAQGYVNSVPAPDDIRTIFTQQTTPTITTETEVVAEEETPQQGTPARRMSPIPQALVQRVQPQTNQPQPTPEETQIAPIDQQAGQVQGGMPQARPQMTIPGMQQPEMPVPPPGIFSPQQKEQLPLDTKQPQQQQFQWSGMIAGTEPQKPQVSPVSSTSQMRISAEEKPKEMALAQIHRNAMNQGELATLVSSLSNPTPESIQRIAQINAEMENAPQSEAMQNLQKEGSFANMLQATPEVIYQSLASMIRSGYGTILGSTAAGAAVGSTIPVLGTLAGTGYGLGTGMVAAGSQVEYASSLMEGLRQQGVNVSDPNELSIAFSNPNIINNARKFAAKRTAAIMVFDAATMGVAGKLGVGRASSTLGNVARLGGELGIQATGGSAGEAFAQFVSGQEINPQDIIMEGLGELGGAPGDIFSAKLRAVKSPEQVQADANRMAANAPMNAEQVDAFVNTSVEAGFIAPDNAEQAKTTLNKANELNAKIPAEIKDTELRVAAIGLIEERDNLNAQLETVDEAFKPAIQEKIKGINEQLQELSQIPQQQGTQAFFETNQPSQTNPLLRLPESVDAVMDKIDQGVLVSAESLFDVYNSVQTAIRETLANRAITPEERSATINILSGMLTDIDRANTEGQRFVEQVEQVSVQDRVPAVREGVKPLPQGQAPKGTATPSISQAKAIREENKRKQAGTTTLPSSGQTIITPAPATTEVKTTENESIKNRNRKDLFPDETEFANVIGGSGRNSNISSYREVNGIGISEYTNPENGLVDVIMTGTSDNDYVGYVRIYERKIKDGKVVFVPTNRWTSKMENKSGNKENFKTMVTEVQKLLPQDHEYTEKTNISLDGLRVFSNNLKRGYEVLTDNNGNPITNSVPLNNATLESLQQAKTEEEVESLYSKKTGITREEFNKIKQQAESLIPNIKLFFNEADGSVVINLPVLKKSPATTEVATEAVTETPTGTTAEAEVTTTPQAGSVEGRTNPALADVESTAKALEGVKKELYKIPHLVEQELSLEEINKIPKGRLHRSEESQQSLIEDIQKNGIKEPIVLIYNVKENTLRVQEGHHRIDVANKLGINNIPTKIQVEWDKQHPSSIDKYSPNQPLDLVGYEKRNYKPSNIGIEELGFTTTEKSISEAYHKAKQDGSSPELVQAVEKLLTPTQDAVQKQTASQVPVQSGTTSSQEVAKGEPKAEPQSTADKGQAQATATQEEVGTTPTAEVATEQAPAKKTLSEEFGISADDVNNLVEQKRKTFEGYSVEMALQELGVPQDKIADALPVYVAEMLEGTLPTKSPTKKQKISEDLIPEGEIKIQPIPSKGKGKPAKTTEEKIDLVSDATDNKSTRDYAKVVHKNADNKEVVATDAHVMIVVKDDSITETESVDVKTGQKADVRYPDYKSVIPDAEKRKDKKRVNAKTIYDLASGIAKATKMFTGRIIPARIVIGDTELFVPAENLKRGLEPFVRSGITDIEISVDGPNRAIVFKGGDITSIVMPVEYKGENAGYTTIISEEQATPATTEQATAQTTPTAETTATNTPIDSVIGTEWDSREGKKKITGEITIKGKKYYTISIDGKSSNALILDSELQDEIKFDKVSFEEKQANETERAEAESKKKEETDKYNDIKGFGDNLSPMQKAKVVSVLNVLESYNGVVKKRKNAIEDFVKEGWFVSTLKSGKKVLMSKDGSFLELSKTQIDYAEYLIENDVLNQTTTPTTTTTEVTLNTPNETTIKDIEKIENATEKGRELALSKPVNKWVKRAFDSFQDLSSRAKKAGIYDGTTLKIGGKEYTVDTPAKFKAFLAQSQANFDAINDAVKDIPSEQKTDTNPSPKTVEEKSKEVFNDAKSTFVFPIGLNPKFKFDSRLPENVVRFFKKYFRPRGLWTKGMFSEKRRMENQISAQVQKSEFLVRDLRNAVKEAYPKGVTQEQLQAMNDVLQGMPREIPANLYAPLTKMREHIDELSQMMISEGIIDEKLVPVFDANMGIYTTRTYAIHNDPKSWLNYIENEPEGQQIRNNAVNFVRQATEAKADRLDKFADENEKRAEKLFRRSELAEGDEALMLQAKADEVIARADKQRQLAEALRSKDFDAYVKAYLEAEGQPLDVVRKGNVGAKDLGILKKRKNIPDAIRALMGEEKDPLTNYTMSVAKMSALIANNQFLNEVKVQGVADGLFTNEPKGKNIEMIASASTDSMSPLNGLYTTKDIAEAFKEFDANTKSPWYIDAMLWLDAAIKVNKTVLSQGTHIRNFISNPIIELANGYIPTLKGKAIDSQMEQILNRRFGDKEKLRDYIIKLTELGVLGQGGNYREILSVYEDLKGNKYDYQKLIEPKITGAAKKSWNIAQKVYKGGDEFWKVVAFENERAVLEKAYGDTKTSEELDQMAADIIRKTRVDYSMVPKAVKAINKIPFTGTFVTFPAEVLRIGANIPAVAYEEMNSGNKVIREHGIKRIAGYLTAMTLPYGVKELAKYLLGMDDEEEEARKKFLAPWAQNSTLIWIGKDRYIDTGFSDAFSILKKPIVAFSRGKSAAEGALSATKEFLGPAISEGLGYKVSKNVLDNTDEFGNPIYDENADIGTIYTQVSTYVLKQVEPGTVSQARRLYLGETGALSEKGQQYRTGDEVLNAVFGIKPVTINWDNAVSYKFRDAVESINNSNKIFLKESKELRKDDKEGRRKAAESTNLAVENAYNDLREYYTSALKIGMIPQKVVDIMKQSGVPKELMYAVVNNTGYKNYIIVLNDGTVIDRNTQRLLRGR